VQMSDAKFARRGTGGMDSLPQQTLGNVLGFLTVKDVCAARGVCSKWRTARATWQTVSDLSLLRLCLFSPTLKIKLFRHTTDADLENLPRKLRRLTLVCARRITEAGFMQLGALAELQVLELAFLTITEAGFAHLVGLSQLKHLRLSRCAFDLPHACIGHLATMSSLETLILVETDSFVDTGMARLGQLTTLRNLTLFEANLTDFDLAHFASLSNLESFSMERCKNATSRGVMFLGQLPRLRKVRLVQVTMVEESWFAAVAASSSLVDLEACECAPLTAAAVAHLAPLLSLKRLKLSHCEALTDETLEALSALVNLHYLSLFGGWKLTSLGLRHVAKLSCLETLDLADCRNISDSGLQYLEALSNLKLLFVQTCLVTTAGLASLKSKLPDLKFCR